MSVFDADVVGLAFSDGVLFVVNLAVEAETSTSGFTRSVFHRHAIDFQYVTVVGGEVVA